LSRSGETTETVAAPLPPWFVTSPVVPSGRIAAAWRARDDCWLDAEICLSCVPYPHRHKGVHSHLDHWRGQIESRLVGVAHDRRDTRTQSIGGDAFGLLLGRGEAPVDRHGNHARPHRTQKVLEIRQ